MGRPLVGSPFWYENNKGAAGNWVEHKINEHMFGESPALVDINGDGKPEAITNSGGKVGWLAPDWSDPGKPWNFTAISAAGDWYEYTHGLGIGDIDKDGRDDIILADHWFKQPPKEAAGPSAIWASGVTEFRETTGKGDGGAQIFAYDVDGDGDNDVVSSLHAHKWGLAWYENTPGAGALQIKWVEHKLMGDLSETAKYGVGFSQPHAMEFADLDGDGLKDIILGKRRWAHGQTGDVDPGGTPVLYWWKLTRAAGKATFTPYLIDDASGVGTQLAVGDVNGDGTLDILSASKLGTFLFLNRSVGTRIWIAPKQDLSPAAMAARFRSALGYDATGRALAELRPGREASATFRFLPDFGKAARTIPGED
jgi:hypothetical protein